LPFGNVRLRKLCMKVRNQLETLLAEKAQLAQDNERLSRENESLQELLHFTMQQLEVPEEGRDASCEWTCSESDEVMYLDVLEEENFVEEAEEGYDV
jgi:hypothetical protein